MKKHLLSLFILFVTVVSLCRAQTPTLWGMTSLGGAKDSGVIFNYNTSTGKEIDVHDFIGGADGASPYGSLLMANNGLLYGMTSLGGTYDSGIIFSYNILTGIETILYNFAGGTDGEYPTGSLIQANNGLLYGMTELGGVNRSGSYGDGTLFSYDISTGKETKLHDFGNDTDGAFPMGSLIQGSDSLLYGMTYNGGTPYWGGGVIFSYTISTGKETVLYDFGSSTQTGNPEGSLIQANNGLLYGMTESGATYDTGQGIIFSYDITKGKETDIHDFGHDTDGFWPTGSLIQASNGLLYGMTPVGGGYDDLGIIFGYNIATGSYTILHYSNDTSSFYSYGSFIQATNGLLYGVGANANDTGIIFNYNISKDKESNIFSFNGQDGNGLSYESFPYLGNMIEDDTVNVAPLSSSICKGNSIMLSANGATSYTWSPSAGLSATTGDSVIANPTANTTYTVGGTFGAKIITRTITVTVNPNPVILANIPSLICSGENTILAVSGAATYTWTPSTGLNATTGDTVIANLTSSITYTIIGTDSFGCSDTTQAIVTVISSPNKPTFSQQGDSLISSSEHDNQWYYNGTLIDTTRAIKIGGSGQYWLVVENEANGCSASSDTLTEIQQIVVNNGKLSIYPNPTSGQFTIKLNNNQNYYTVEIYNVLGGKVYESVISNSQNIINLNSQSTGLYFVYLKSDETVEVGKVILTK